MSAGPTRAGRGYPAAPEDRASGPQLAQDPPESVGVLDTRLQWTQADEIWKLRTELTSLSRDLAEERRKREELERECADLRAALEEGAPCPSEL